MALGRSFVGSELGDVRDLDVYQDNLQHYTKELPEADGTYLSDFQQHLAKQWRQARKQLLECLSSDRYDELKASFTEFLQSGPSEFGGRTVGSSTENRGQLIAVG
jgi:CHAD domain-containing protein